MKCLFLLFFLICCTVYVTSFGWNNWKSGQAVLLEDVGALTFYKDQHTASRRSSPLPQLRCLGKDCNDKWAPSVVQCKNSGSAGQGNIQWECKAELPTGVRFGRVNVNCEGYNGPNDQYVLEGSCALEYNLIGSPSFSWESAARPHHSYRPDAGKTAGGTGLFLVLLALGAYIFFVRKPHGARANQPRREGLFGSGIGMPFGMPFGGNFFGGGNTNRGGFDQTQDQRKYQQENRGPGFWTGMLGGTGLGYLAGRRAGRNQQVHRERTYEATRPGDRPYSPPVVPQETTHESTGFGGTTRR